MTAVLRADALRIPLRDESVDLIVTSPPYFALRSYRDGGEHYDGQIGSEPTPQAFLEALWAVTAECWRVLKPSGSMFVNLGDKRSGSGGAPTMVFGKSVAGLHPKNYPGQSAATRGFGRQKSKMLLPHRYAIGCEDGAADPDGVGWIVRQDMVWAKPNGLPESVRDRTRDAHEYWFHLTKQGDYFAAVDEIRDEPSGYQRFKNAARATPQGQRARGMADTTNARGALPRSVWEIPTEPLTVPEHLGVDHFAAFPSEWPRRLILGWSPSGICTACGEGRRPTTTTTKVPSPAHGPGSGTGKVHGGGPNDHRATDERFNREHRITGYVCACTPFTDHPRGRDRNPDRGRRNTIIGGQEEEEERLRNWRPPREYHLDGWTPPPLVRR